MEYWEARKRTSPEKTRSGRTKRLRSLPPTKTTTNQRSSINRLRNPRNSLTSFRFSPSSASSSPTSPLTIRLKQIQPRLTIWDDFENDVLAIRSLRNLQEIGKRGPKYRFHRKIGGS
ncbi:hypothetical protein Acr_00g0028760 [Actinidia rufa]|uniref:Uncharacterized protein n=1 Tax=Actinidia rufa TaxID=165716 RepID=A0A7J0DEC1_9ERIC|nr:hypothetical protein Acr_00g0028760 [Actinidia rufa]